MIFYTIGIRIFFIRISSFLILEIIQHMLQTLLIKADCYYIQVTSLYNLDIHSMNIGSDYFN